MEEKEKEKDTAATHLPRTSDGYLVKLSLSNGVPGRKGKSLQGNLVFIVKASNLVASLNHPEHLAPSYNGAATKRSSFVAKFLINAAVEPLVIVGVSYVELTTRLYHEARDSLAGRNGYFLEVLASKDDH